MPANYTGDPAGEVDELPTIACPVDGDARNAVTVNTPLQKIADVLAFLINRTHPNVLADGQTRVLISEADDNRGTSSPKTRIYLNLDGEIEIARNCHWEPLDGEWLADIWYPSRTKAGSSLLILGVDGPQLRTYGSAVSDPTINGWADSAWYIHAAFGESGFLKFYDVIDPAATEAQANTLRAKNVCKAWGLIRWNAGTVSIVDGFNVAAAVNLGTPPRGVTIYLAAGMAGTGYAPVCSIRPVSSIGGSPRFSIVSASEFSISIVDSAGSPVDLTGADVYFAFQVFGRQDT